MLYILFSIELFTVTIFDIELIIKIILFYLSIFDLHDWHYTMSSKKFSLEFSNILIKYVLLLKIYNNYITTSRRQLYYIFLCMGRLCIIFV